MRYIRSGGRPAPKRKMDEYPMYVVREYHGGEPEPAGKGHVRNVKTPFYRRLKMDMVCNVCVVL